MTAHYFSAAKPAKPAETRQLTVALQGREYKVQVADQVFSGHRLDLGTAVLLGAVPPVSAEVKSALDLGCGWGPISLALAAAATQAEVWAVDVNERALALTKANAQRAGLENVLPLEAEAALQAARESGTKFDLIWSNPPVRIGKAALRQLLLTWLALLAPDGEAWLVVQRHLGADSLAAWLRTQGWEVTKEASRKGYRILRVTPASLP